MAFVFVKADPGQFCAISHFIYMVILTVNYSCCACVVQWLPPPSHRIGTLPLQSRLC